METGSYFGSSCLSYVILCVRNEVLWEFKVAGNTVAKRVQGL